MGSDDDPLAKELRSFSDAHRIAREDEAAAAVELREQGNRLIQAAPAAITGLQEALAERVNRLTSAETGQRIECSSVGSTTTIRLGIVEATLSFNRGRPSDAFGPILPSADFVLSRTSQTIGADLMPPEHRTYKTPPRKSERLRPVLSSGGKVWDVHGDERNAAEVADYVVEQLVAYFKAYGPR